MTQDLDAETTAIVNLMESRKNVYRMLSRCFAREIDAAFADEFVNDFAFESDDETLVGILGIMQDSLSNINETGIEMLAVDFDRVFFGMGPLTARHAFPYESVYTSDRGIMMQDAYAQVAKIYREQMLQKDSSFTEPEDHIAVELAFMATLAERTAEFLCKGFEEAAEETVSQQQAFLQNHLLNWAERFCIDLKAACDGFYGALADFLIEFLKTDSQLLSEMLN